GAPGLTAARIRSSLAAAIRAAGQSSTHATVVPPTGPVDYRAVGEAIGLGAYRFTKYLTGDRRPKTTLDKVSVFVANAVGGVTAKSAAKAGARRAKPVPTDRHAKAALTAGLHIAAAVGLARDAINEPPNVVVPASLAAIARALARTHGFKAKVLDKRGIQAAGMNLHYAVGQGSVNEPRFIHLTYQPRQKPKRRIVFVGKGLTFDSGGLCIKPAPGMGDMKSDMAGAAAVLGLMAAVGHLRPHIEIHGIVGAAENMPDGEAYRPADVLTSLDGKTVEIINTDAEGRLVLADALCYAARLKPDLIVDAATLTGAALVALGKSCSAFYATDDGMAQTFALAARDGGEQFWRMPLLEDLREQLKSDVADLKHTGDRNGGSITAALFLREFVANTPWIHCDIAGPALSDRDSGVTPKGGTGHAVMTFVRLVERLAGG
ncbi:MAG: leucyl aminopeptidase, partial [Pseudomonadota bacterium]